MPRLIFIPVLNTERLLCGRLAALGNCVFKYLLLCRGQGLDLVEEALHCWGMPIWAYKSVERLYQMPDRALNLRLQARMHVVLRTTAPLFTGRDEFEFDDTLGTEIDLHRTIERLAAKWDHNADTLL